MAPSPTGLLHLGHAATFLAGLLLAPATITALYSSATKTSTLNVPGPEFVSAMLEDLAWLGITWTPPIITQSQRLPLYREALNQLLITGQIYPCHCSRKDLAAMMHAPHDDHAAQEPDDERVYPNICRPPQGQQLETPFQPHTNYRLRVPDGEVIRFHDQNLGPQSFIAGIDFGDFLIWRKDNFPSYQLACIVDDADTHITEVVRGRDLLKSTARQILLQQALQLPTPAYFHTALILDAEGQRLAKRHDALSLRTLGESGATPKQIIQRISQPL